MHVCVCVYNTVKSLAMNSESISAVFSNNKIYVGYKLIKMSKREKLR